MCEKIKGVPIELVIDKYKELQNVWKVGEYFGISGQTIHSRLKQVGIIKPINCFTDEDYAVLLEKYESYKTSGRLQELAEELGRTKQFICRKAKELGLTGGVKKYNYSQEKREQLSAIARERIEEHGHPRGATGMRHTEEAKAAISAASKMNWEKHSDEWRGEERRRLRSDVMMKSYEDGVLGVRSRCYLFCVTVGGKTFLAKSSWEYDIALYLEYLKSKGLITDWEYESTVFRFKYNTLGVRTYRPDFTIKRGDDVYYLEVKGWEDDKYIKKKQLMEQEYPKARIIYIKSEEYNLIRKKHKDEISGWGEMKKLAGKMEAKCSVEGCENHVHSNGLCRHHFYEKYRR